MKFSHVLMVFASFIAVVCIVLLARQRDSVRTGKVVQAENVSGETKQQESRDGQVFIGGVWRPEKDVVSKKELPSASITRKSKLPNVGTSQYVSAEANPNVASIVDSIDDSSEIINRTILGEAEPFEADEFKQDPKAYTDKFVPSRVWQSLPPGDDVPAISIVGDNLATLVQGESAILRAKTLPSMPVTFYSGRLGEFENKLNAISVVANDQGIAEASFKASGGTRGQINIIASSPVTSGQARFLVKVKLPVRN